MRLNNSKWLEDPAFCAWVRNTHYINVSDKHWRRVVGLDPNDGNPTPLWADIWRKCALMYTAWCAREEHRLQ